MVSEDEIISVTQGVLSREEFLKGRSATSSLFSWLYEKIPGEFWSPFFTLCLILLAAVILISIAKALINYFNTKSNPPFQSQPDAPEPRLNCSDPVRNLLSNYLKHLDHNKWITLSNWKTNKHYVKECTHPGAQSELKEIAQMIDKSIFGNSNIPEEWLNKYHEREKEWKVAQ